MGFTFLISFSYSCIFLIIFGLVLSSVYLSLCVMGMKCLVWYCSHLFSCWTVTMCFSLFWFLLIIESENLFWNGFGVYVTYSLHLPEYWWLVFGFWSLSWYDNIMCVSQPRAPVWMFGFLMIEIFSPCSCLWWSDLCYLLKMFKCCFLLHTMVMLTCINVSCDVFLCLGALSPSLMHVLVCASVFCWKFLVGVFIIFSLGFYNEILPTLNLVDNLLWGIVAWFFSVGLVSCRCPVDLPGVKTLLLTN